MTESQINEKEKSLVDKDEKIRVITEENKRLILTIEDLKLAKDLAEQ